MEHTSVMREGLMDFESYYTKASEYVNNERDQRFSSQVIELMNREDLEELHDRFYTELKFGTAGMRGVIGGGTNRMNPHVVERVTQGLANYLLACCDTTPSVVIAYDTREYSDLFAQCAACVLAANGIRVYLFDEVTPVPILSFAVRHLSADAGITITASHNPAKYNGYKVYWSDGAQVIAPHDQRIVAEVASIDGPQKISYMPYMEAREQELIISVPEELLCCYQETVLSHIIHPELFENGLDAPIVYTPLHGSGRKPVLELFSRLSIPVTVVKEQEAPDGRFPTVRMPNPEDPDAMRLALDLAKARGAELVLGTDPDSDRLGIGIRESDGSYSLLDGNQIAVLLADYMCQSLPEGQQAVVVRSIVTTDLVDRIATSHGIEVRSVLTGFKYIADQMHSIAGEKKRFLLGAEESYGYLTIPEVYDKDAVSTALRAVEMVLYHKREGKSLSERLDEIYREYGYHMQRVISREYPGSEGRKRIEAIMASFREMGTSSLGSLEISQVVDLLSEGTGLPPSDVVILSFGTTGKVIVRPSGTEPKIKYYLFAVSEDGRKESCQESMRALEEALGLSEKTVEQGRG